MSESAQPDGPTIRRRVLALSVVVVGIGLVLAGMLYMPEHYRVLLFGKTVEHCPESELSCPSQKPGLLLFLIIPALVLLAWSENDDE